MTSRQAKIQRDVSEALLRACPDRVDRLNALVHAVAADLQGAHLSPEEVTGYLLKITGMLDGKFDRPHSDVPFRAAASVEKAPEGADVRYGGRTIKMEVFVNTDAPIEEVATRTQIGAQGDRIDMVLVAAGEVSGPAVNRMWEKVAKEAEKRRGASS